MDMVDSFSFLPVIVVPLMILSAAWHVAVLVFLFKIWRRVTHLPG